MGFSVSGSAAIIFIAAFVGFGILYTSAYNSFELVDTALDDKEAQEVAALRDRAAKVRAAALAGEL